MLPYQDKYQQQLAKIRDKYHLRRNHYEHSYQQENMSSSFISTNKLSKYYQVPPLRSKQLLGNSMIKNQSISTKSTIFDYKYKDQDKKSSIKRQEKIHQYQNNYRRSLIMTGNDQMIYKEPKQVRNHEKFQAIKTLRTYSKQTQSQRMPKYLDKYKDALEKAYQYGKQIGFKFRKYGIQDQCLKNNYQNTEKAQSNKIYYGNIQDKQESVANAQCNANLSRFDTSFSFGKDNSPEKKKQQVTYYDSPIRIIKQAEKQQAIQQQQSIKTKIEQSKPFESDIIKLKPIEIQQDRDIARLDNIKNRIDSYIQRNKLKY